MENVSDVIRVTYIPSEDVTIIWRDLYVGDNIAETSIVGWYHGEPHDDATATFSSNSLTARYHI
jgi:hypothetical protein